VQEHALRWRADDGAGEADGGGGGGGVRGLSSGVGVRRNSTIVIIDASIRSIVFDDRFFAGGFNMAAKTISFTTFNLLNLNEPGLPIHGKPGWTKAQYDKKIEWTRRNLITMQADIFGFQELWHHDSLQNAFAAAGLGGEYTLLAPANHKGGGIICAGAVRTSMLVGQPTWVAEFPKAFKLDSKGDDAQAGNISVKIDTFSRPVLKFTVNPGAGPNLTVYVCHLKSKNPTRLDAEKWFQDDKPLYSPHRDAIGAAISTIRRTAEAAAFRIMATNQTKGTDDPIVVIGDLNDGQHSNTLNILTNQPNYLTTLMTGGSDTDLYSAQTLQQYRSETDVYYTHVFQDRRESLDHILFSQEFYDNSKSRIWAFAGMEIANDHLNRDDHKVTGTNDHGIVRVSFTHKPAVKAKKPA
jgi:endonuclease/exonuclease/phosphatase family metal-dependent hydrolase